MTLLGSDDDAAPASAVVGPLAPWACAAVGGAAAGERMAVAGLDRAVLAGLCLAGLVLAVALALAAPATARFQRYRGLLTVVAVAAVLAGAAGLRVAALDEGLLPGLAARGGTAHLDVVVAREPRPTDRGWHVDVRVHAVDGAPTREGAALVLHDGADDGDPPILGERWAATASARPLPDGGYGRWLARRHARVLLDPVRLERAGAPGPLARGSEHVRDRVRVAATAHTPEAVGGLLVGMVTGDRRLLPEQTRTAMEATSLTHLTAVSGTHVAVLVAGVLGLCGLLRLGAAGRRRSVALALLGFAYLTRFEPSVLRAGTMGAVLLLAVARGVPRDARHALAAAVLLLVLVDPLLATTLGLLLSATATAGVLLLAPRIAERLGRVRWLPRRVAEVLGVTVGAQVAVVPLLLASFGEVPLAAVPANLLAVPAGALTAGLGFLGAGVAVLHAPAGAVVFMVAGLPARVVVAVAEAFAGTGGLVEIGRPLGVIALVAVSIWLTVRAGTAASRVAAVAALLAVAATALGALMPRAPVTSLQVTAIDVGQGDALLLESPAARVLVDAGGDEAAARWLRRAGRPRIDLAVVTHPHRDHVGGMAEVLGTVDVGQVWYRPLPTDLEAVEELLAAAAREGVEVAAPVVGQRARVGDLAIEVLSPPPGRPYRSSGSESNDSSLVLRASWHGRRVLFTGDVEAAAQHDLLRRPERLTAEVLAVPHHGAGTTEAAFLRAVDAQVGLIGVGADNPHGHPHDDVLAALAEQGTVVRRTDRDGTVTVVVPAPRDDRDATRARPDRSAGRRRRPGDAARIGSRHGARPPARRRRRPPAAARGRPPRRGPARAGPRARGRDPRRDPDRAPAGAAHPVAVRRPSLRGAARGGGRQR